jgi:Leu/Phe-tRNA-protein transferase
VVSIDTMVTIVNGLRCDFEVAKKKDFKNFPIRLNLAFSNDIDNCVFYTKSASKHQYILDAIREKVDRDKEKFKDASNQ